MTIRWSHRIVSILGLIAFLAAIGCSARGAVVGEPPAASSPAGQATSANPLAIERDRLTRTVRAAISGRDGEPATAVFKNVLILTANVSAGNLLQAMNFYGTALGVSCTHCHDVNDFAADAKPQKAIAREMMRMNGTINGQLLKGIAGLQSANPSVNCVTCHRGQLVPARALPSVA